MKPLHYTIVEATNELDEKQYTPMRKGWLGATYLPGCPGFSTLERAIEEIKEDARLRRATNWRITRHINHTVQ